MDSGCGGSGGSGGGSWDVVATDGVCCCGGVVMRQAVFNNVRSLLLAVVRLLLLMQLLILAGDDDAELDALGIVFRMYIRGGFGLSLLDVDSDRWSGNDDRRWLVICMSVILGNGGNE